MENSLSLITSGTQISNLKEVLKNWKPSNKIEVVKMLSFISVTNNATVTKKIKDACYEYLNNRCAECENAIDPESGLEVKRVEVNKNIFNESLEIQNIKKEIEVLKKRLKDAEEAAGVSHTETSFYYKAVL
ncbi:MAG: hypothetical protein KBH21_00320 [Acetoanaerobium sp.]|nr:hypothetical protein [Acetoanaerobium sp.]